jgi:hypothetical protein
MRDQLRRDYCKRREHAGRAYRPSYSARTLPPRALALELGNAIVLRFAPIGNLRDQLVRSDARANV